MEIKITETVLRDANQSLVATRLPVKKFEEILETLDSAGYHSLECWGGATFDSCLRYLNEDPWERLRLIRKHVKNTKLQMLFRGQNILGYKHYSDESVRAFVRLSIENGIDIIRIFDALNDFTNIEVAVDECIKCGAHAQGTICFTKSPIHNLEMYIEMGKTLEKMGCHSICIKDMAGIMSPQEAFELVSALKKNCSLPIAIHTHTTTGLAAMTYLKSVEAGADIIDCAISSFSGGTSQPATESLVYTLEQFGYKTNIKWNILNKINKFFAPIADEYIKSGMLNPYVLGTKTEALIYQIPGGMLSNLIAQLTAQNALHKLDDVLYETPKVREDLGYPPLVTPMSQMVGVQAAMNVLAGERYKNISKEIRSYVKGEYGKAPGEINPDIIKMVLGNEKPIEGRFADTLENEIELAKKDLGDLAKSEEDLLSYVAFPLQAEQYFKSREEKRVLKANYTIERVD